VLMNRGDSPELLAPAGDFDAMRAAVVNGADAVYFGLSDLNARRRAANFTRPQLPEVMKYLHDHNVRGYVALNTLIYSDELPAAVEFAKACAAGGADAIIIQDLGLVRLIHAIAPTLPIHGSTQMTLTDFQLPTSLARLKPRWMSVNLAMPRHRTMLPGGESRVLSR